MPEAVAYAIEYFAAAAGTEMTLTAGQILAASQAIVAVASVYTLREQQRRAQNAARDSYNSSLRDRYVMSRGTAEPRQLVLGRQRVSGPIAFLQSYGTDRQNLVMCVLLAAHEIDAVEAIYLGDEQAKIDGSGNVLSVKRRDTFTMTGATGSFDLSSDPAAGTVTATVSYGSSVVALTVGTISGRTVPLSGGTVGQTGTVVIQYQPAQSPYVNSSPGGDLSASIALDGTGSGSVNLPVIPVSGSVFVIYPGDAYLGINAANLAPYITVVGTIVTIAGAPVTSTTVNVTYRQTENPTRMRIRSYLGGSGQVADATLVAALPGLWTSSHKLTGQAYLVVECDFDPDAFPSGLPNISAVVRGAKCYDPRTGTTVWTENPALLLRHAATHALCGRLPTGLINDTVISSAATVCDTSAAYVVNGQTYTRALYTAGTVYKSGARPIDVINDLAAAMAGRWCFVDGQLRVRAGAYATPLQTLDETWLSGGSAIQVQARPNRSDVFNVCSGHIVDELRDYTQVDYPRVASSAYITEDGAELPLEVNLNCVSFTGQAQQVVAAMMRDARQGLRVQLTCNMRAYQVEPFDVINVTLARFGWSSKPFEVLDVSWTLDGGIQLQLKETSSTTWALGTSFAASDPAPNTLLPSPWAVPSVTSLACASGTTELQLQADGTVNSTIKVTWATITDRYITESGGGVEVRYGLGSAPESQWRSVLAPEGVAQVRLTDVQDGRIYMVKARAYTTITKGPWTPVVAHLVVGKSAAPSNVAGLTAIVVQGGVQVSWTPSAELDYADSDLRIGATWSSATPLFRGTANTYTWPWPAAGSYTLSIKHRDSTGNVSSAASTVAVTVDAAMQVQWANEARTSAGGNLLLCGAMALPGFPNRAGGWNLYANLSMSVPSTGGPIGSGPYQSMTATAARSAGTSLMVTGDFYPNGGMREPGFSNQCDAIISFYARTAPGPFVYNGKMGVTPSGGSGTSVDILNPNMTTSWQRYAIQFSAWSGGVNGAFDLLHVSALVSGASIEVGGVQVEYGHTLTNYSETLYGPANTANLAVNAATGRVSVAGAANTFTTTLTTVQTGTIITTGGEVSVWVGGSYSASGSLVSAGGVLLHCELWRDSTLIATGLEVAINGTGGFSGSAPLSIRPATDTPAAGSHTYTIKAKWIANGGSPFSVTASTLDAALVMVEHKV